MFHHNSNSDDEVLICSYLDEFIKAMGKHAKQVDNELEEEMFRKFQTTIYKILHENQNE